MLLCIYFFLIHQPIITETAQKKDESNKRRAKQIKKKHTGTDILLHNGADLSDFVFANNAAIFDLNGPRRQINNTIITLLVSAVRKIYVFFYPVSFRGLIRGSDTFRHYWRGSLRGTMAMNMINYKSSGVYYDLCLEKKCFNSVYLMCWWYCVVWFFFWKSSDRAFDLNMMEVIWKNRMVIFLIT